MSKKHYIELLEGYLMNHFRPYSTYEEGVESAKKELASDSEYFEEMKNVFLYFLSSKNLEKDTVRDIVRRGANYFVSNDENALKKLHFIYEDTLLDEATEKKEQHIEELFFDANSMDVDVLIKKIHNKELDFETRINAALLLRKSKDVRFRSILLDAVKVKQEELRHGFVLVLLWGDNWEDKFDWLSSLMMTDDYLPIKKSIAHYLKENGTDVADEEQIIQLLLAVLKQDLQKSIQRSCIKILVKYGVNALNAVINRLDFSEDGNRKIFSLFLKQFTIDSASIAVLTDLLKDTLLPVQLMIVESFRKCNDVRIIDALSRIIEDKDSSQELKLKASKTLNLINEKSR